MKILILTNSNPYVKAGIVALYLHQGFLNKGFNSKLVVKEYGVYKDKNIVCIEKKQKIIIVKIKNKFNKVLKRIFPRNNSKDLNKDYSIHNYDLRTKFYDTSEILEKIHFKPDAILYLFPQNFLNAQNLYELNKATGAPIFWYLMDSAALTGGCHYFWDCSNYKTGCGKCPGMKSNIVNDQSYVNFNFKYENLNKTDIHIITATKRQYKQSKESLMFGKKPIHNILLPVDHEVFKPAIKYNLRKKLDLPLEKKIIFFGAGSLKSKRKGMRYLTDALKIVTTQNSKLEFMVLIAGNHFDYIKNDLNLDYKYLGVLDNDEQLAIAYQVSNVFVCPSIEEAGPLMINQSIMTGTPVVSFDMGVANDLIIDGETGYIAELYNTKDLANKIIKILTLKDSELQILSVNCRELGLKYLKQDVFFNEFEKVLKTS